MDGIVGVAEHWRNPATEMFPHSDTHRVSATGAQLWHYLNENVCSRPFGSVAPRGMSTDKMVTGWYFGCG